MIGIVPIWYKCGKMSVQYVYADRNESFLSYLPNLKKEASQLYKKPKDKLYKFADFGSTPDRARRRVRSSAGSVMPPGQQRPMTRRRVSGGAGSAPESIFQTHLSHQVSSNQAAKGSTSLFHLLQNLHCFIWFYIFIVINMYNQSYLQCFVQTLYKILQNYCFWHFLKNIANKFSSKYTFYQGG